MSDDNLPSIQPQNESAQMLAVIERAAMSKDVDVEKMERLLTLQERLLSRSAEEAFNRSMVSVQTELRAVAADAENKQTHSKYATYAALDKVLRPVYTSKGFSLSFDTEESATDTVKVICYVSHIDGHTRKYRVLMPADGKGAKGGDVMTKTHAAGSAMSYGMRYLLKMIFNVAIGESDDDGNGGDIGDYITKEQAEELRAMIKDKVTGATRFCDYLSKTGKLPITCLEEIPAKMFGMAKDALRAKR